MIIFSFESFFNAYSKCHKKCHLLGTHVEILAGPLGRQISLLLHELETLGLQVPLLTTSVEKQQTTITTTKIILEILHIQKTKQQQ